MDMMAARSTGVGILGPILLLAYFAVVVLVFAGMWKAFVKAGQPGWGCLVPIYNVYLILLIAGKPTWWLLLWLIPVVGLVVSIIVMIVVAEQFGKGAGFGVGLALLGMIFWPILGFGKSQYGGSEVRSRPTPPLVE